MMPLLRIIFRFFFESTTVKKIGIMGLILIGAVACSKSSPPPSQRSSFQEKQNLRSAKAELPSSPVSPSPLTIQKNSPPLLEIKNSVLNSVSGNQNLSFRAESPLPNGELVQEKRVVVTAKSQEDLEGSPSSPSATLNTASIDSFFGKISAPLPSNLSASPSGNIIFIPSAAPVSNSPTLTVPQKGELLSVASSTLPAASPTTSLPVVISPTVGSNPALAIATAPSFVSSNIVSTTLAPTPTTTALPMLNATNVAGTPTLIPSPTGNTFAELTSNFPAPQPTTFTKSLPALSFPTGMGIQAITPVAQTALPLATVPENIVSTTPTTTLIAQAVPPSLQINPITTPTPVAVSLTGGVETGIAAITPSATTGGLPSIAANTLVVSGNPTPEVLQVNLSTSTYHPPTTLIASPGSVPSGQPTEIQQGIEGGGLRVAINISGQVSLPSLSSSDPCQGPFATPPTITVWEKKWGESDWNPSTDPKDNIVADSWGIFSHLFEFARSAYSDDCTDRTVKLKIAYDLGGTHYETDSGEFNCQTPVNQLPPPQVTLPSSCNPPEVDLDPLTDRFSKGKYLDQDVNREGFNMSPF